MRRALFLFAGRGLLFELASTQKVALFLPRLLEYRV